MMKGKQQQPQPEQAPSNFAGEPGSSIGGSGYNRGNRNKGTVLRDAHFMTLQSPSGKLTIPTPV